MKRIIKIMGETKRTIIQIVVMKSKIKMKIIKNRHNKIKKKKKYQKKLNKGPKMTMMKSYKIKMSVAEFGHNSSCWWLILAQF